jgi:thiol-disulfide isomerase/thioredoxin
MKSNVVRLRRCAGAIVLASISVLCFHDRGQTRAFASEPTALVGAQAEMLPDAPDFTLKTVDGKSVHLKDLKGKAVVLNFWATWCIPCKQEIPWLVSFQKQYGPQGLVILGLSMDESPPAVRKFLHTTPVNYRVLIANQLVADRYFVKGLPTSIYIDANGRITDQVPGGSSRTVMENEIKLALTNAVGVVRQ